MRIASGRNHVPDPIGWVQPLLVPFASEKQNAWQPADAQDIPPEPISGFQRD
jgi:hypothetical protein